MKKRFCYLALSLIAFTGGIVVAFIINQHSFLRGFAGDILIVIFIYSSIKIVFKNCAPLYVASGVLSFSIFVELLQLAGIPKCFDPKSIVTILTLGSTFDPFDIAAYMAGAVIIYSVDVKIIHKIDC